MMDELNNPAVVTIVDMEVDGEGITSANNAQVPSEAGERPAQTIQGDDVVRVSESPRWPCSNRRMPHLQPSCESLMHETALQQQSLTCPSHLPSRIP